MSLSSLPADRRALPATIVVLTAPAVGLGYAAQWLPVAWCAAGGLTLAALAFAVTRRNRRHVVVVAPVADIRAIGAGHTGVPEREPAAIEAA